MMAETPQTIGRALAVDHWRYVQGVLEAQGVEPETVAICGYHHKEAFNHGFKHGIGMAAQSTRTCDRHGTQFDIGAGCPHCAADMAGGGK